jgi:peptide/nickel transport system substrate-binding protein
MKKIYLVLIMLICSTLLFAQGPKKGGIFNIATPTNPQTLDSTMTTDQGSSLIMGSVIEELFTLDNQLKTAAHLADSYTISADGLTYFIKLRQGVLFHNGKEMTSDDVHASIKRFFKNNGKKAAENVDRIEKDGKYGIKIVTTKKLATFIDSISSWYGNANIKVFPKEILDKYIDTPIKDPADLIGTGPYKLARFSPDQHAQLVRFDDYVPSSKPFSGYAGHHIAYFDEIRWHFVQEESIRIAGLQTNEYQFAFQISTDKFDMLEQHPDTKPIYTRILQSLVTFNCGQPPFDNINARQAIAYGLDYQDMGRAMNGDEKFWSTNDGSFYNESLFWHKADAGQGVFNKTDLKKAKQLLAKSGYDGQEIVIVNNIGSPPFKNGATALKAQLEKIGFKVKLLLTDRATVVAKRATKDEWNIHLTFFGSFYPDPNVWGNWAGTNGWITNWKDQYSMKMDEIFSRMGTEFDLNKRKEIVHEWMDYMWKTTPYIKLHDWGRALAERNENRRDGNFNNYQYFHNTWFE